MPESKIRGKNRKESKRGKKEKEETKKKRKKKKGKYISKRLVILIDWLLLEHSFNSLPGYCLSLH